ncbi:MAG TPA: SOS response-associated peptidase [Rhodospirillales bacterium]|jgi:putative SOS response-associated peptidase YedK
MCSRFEMNAQPRELARRFGLKSPPPVPNAPELRPTNQALVIDRAHAGGDGPAGRLLAWGLVVTWDKNLLINVRAETLAEKRAFRLLLGSRCLVPATTWFEWRKVGRAKLKNRIAPNSGGIFAFAGLADGARFTVVTCAAAPGVAHIHHRMPVVLAPATEAAWMDPTASFAEVKGALVPYVGALAAAEESPPGIGRPGQSDLFR